MELDKQESVESSDFDLATAPVADDLNDLVPATAIDAPSTLTFADILRKMTDADNAISADFDPEKVVGELRGKIDDLKRVIVGFETYEVWFDKQAAPFVKAAGTLRNNCARLKAYIVRTMQAEKFDSLPGILYKAQLQNNQASMDLLREPTALDFRDYPDFVEPIRGYEWKTAEIKKTIVARARELGGEDVKIEHYETAAQELAGQDKKPFAAIRVEQQVRFPPNIPESLAPAKKSRRKKKS